jgi:Putative esterase
MRAAPPPTIVRRIGAALAPALVLGAGIATAAPPCAGAHIDVRFSAAVHPGPLTGRVYVAVGRRREPAPLQRTGATGVPLFGHDVVALAPGRAAAIDACDDGAPLASLRDLPAGTYWMQPFVNVYTEFRRRDGHTLWMHMDRWEGQDWRRSPGNLFGAPQRVRFDPRAAAPITLLADRVIPPVAVPPDTAFVKRIRLRSALLSRWWGQPMDLGATVLLPRGYATHPDVRYPVIYDQGHFTLDAPGGFDHDAAFRAYWLADGTPRFLLVTLQHPSPFYDDSYAVNSVNEGPFDDAIHRELLPAVEARFRIRREPWARILTGESTGGWIALAQQIFHPRFYGGTFASCPDPVDFHHDDVVDIYHDANAYALDKGWVKIERVEQRRPDGNVDSTMRDANRYELAVGDRSRSGGQWDIWEAAWGPIGADGYPRRLWDKRSGAIDHAVAAYWRAHFDLLHILESRWHALGPLLADKLHLYVGDADTYNLNVGVHALDAFLRSARNPRFGGSVSFQPMAPHCWGPRGGALIGLIAAYIDGHAPRGADLASWRY